MYLQYGKNARATGFTTWLISAADRLAQSLERLYRAYEGHRTARALTTLDERTLNDIGLSRADVERAYYAPAFQDPRVDLEIARFNRISSRKRPIRRRQ